MTDVLWNKEMRQRCIKEQTIENWHLNHNDMNSTPYKRNKDEQNLIKTCLNSIKNNVNIISICSGQARDILPILAGKKDNNKINTYLIDTDLECLEYADNYAKENKIPNVHLINKNAGLRETYNDIPQADIIIICGVFGHLSLLDIKSTISFIKHLLNENGFVIWSRHKFDNDISEDIKNIFKELNFNELAFVSPEDEPYTLGLHVVDGKTDIFNYIEYEYPLDLS